MARNPRAQAMEKLKNMVMAKSMGTPMMNNPNNSAIKTKTKDMVAKRAAITTKPPVTAKPSTPKVVAKKTAIQQRMAENKIKATKPGGRLKLF